MRKHLFKKFHAARQNLIKIMFLIKFPEYLKKMCSFSGAFKLLAFAGGRIWLLISAEFINS